jgi:hypothetical protein
MSDYSIIFSIVALIVSVTSLIITVVFQTRNVRLTTFNSFLDQLGSKKLRRDRNVIRNDQVHKIWKDKTERQLERLDLDKEYAKLKKSDAKVRKSLAESGESLEWIAREVAVAYDRVGFVLKHYPAMEVEILEWNGSTISEMWKMLGPLVLHRWSTKDKFTPDFETLGEKAVKYTENKRNYERMQNPLTRLELWFNRKGRFTLRNPPMASPQ